MLSAIALRIAPRGRTYLDSQDLRVQLPSLVGGDTSSNDRPAHTASSSECGLAWQEDIWDVLVLAKQWEVEDNLDRLDVGGENDEFTNTSVEGLGSFVRSAGVLAHDSER